METTRRRRALPEPEPQDTRPARQNTASPKTARGAGIGGWGGMKSTLAEGGGFARPMKFTDGEDPIVVKFLDAEPFDSYRAHWIDKPGRRSYRHLTGDCPLCDPFGDQPQATAVCFNVVSFEDPANPKFEFIQAGARLARKLEALAGDRRFKGLDDPRLYIAISATGKGTSTEYQAEVIKMRDLDEDWDITALSDQQLAAFREKAYEIGSSVEEIPTVEELHDLVKELTK
jgi:hypothetical protein